MEGLPQIRDKTLLPVDIASRPYLTDHCFLGHAVLPAVEAMQMLAASVKSVKPDADVTNLSEARFDKFFYLKPGSDRISAFVDISIYENGDVTARLITKTTSQKSRITRTRDHAVILFPASIGQIPQIPIDIACALEGVSFDIPEEKIYSELVRFGPAYHNIKGMLHISKDGAVAEIIAPVFPENNDRMDLLGSPFPLDAAFHAACVWGQRFRHLVAFPVGLEKRVVLKKTNPGETCFCRVVPVNTESDLLIFDAWIYDSVGVLLEAVSGIQMRDISAGAMKPPQWIINDGTTDKHDQRISDQYCLSIIERNTLMPFAEKALSTDELKRLEKMGRKRKKSYLAARLACKRLSRRLSGNDMDTPADRISTISHDLVRPCCPLTDGSRAVSCAASHDSRFAVAIASGKRVGIDVEKISERVLKSRELYMTEDEKAVVDASFLGEIQAALRIWSIKEAAAKALNTTLADSWNRVRVKNTGRDESRVEIDGKGRYPVLHYFIDDHLFTIIEMP
jgi:phosphopantetheinyl transferase (holo-ACP synthase)